MTVPEAFRIAVEHHQAGRWAEAETLCRQILEVDPLCASAWNLLAVVGLDGGRWSTALDGARRAVALAPNEAHFHCTLGFVLNRMGEPSQAVGVCLQALKLQPECAPAYFGIAKARTLQGRLDDAIAAYQDALRFKTDYADAASNLGVLLMGRGDFDAALSAYHLAVQASPNHAAAHNNLGEALRELGRTDEAIACFRRALAINPALSGAHSNLILTLHYASGTTAAMIAAECRQWWVLYGAPLSAERREHPHDPAVAGRLRVGYVSGDFCEHPVARHILPVLREHDARQFEVVCYSGVTRPDAMTERFRALHVQWREMANLNDDELAARIREDRIDILIDLSLHTRGNRLLVFARQPAPVQASFAGYPGTTGLGTIAYRLTDRFLEPEGEAAASAAEQPIRLGDSFWCFDEPEDAPEINVLPAIDRGCMVFGCLHKFCKINRGTLELWSRVMRGVPNARLRMLCPTEQTRAWLVEQFSQFGVASERLEFARFQAREHYMGAYRELDLILDTFPYNGHMTTCDALWMGVPVISLAGEMPISRGGLSLLSNVGLGELVAFSEDDYVRIAVDLARDRPRLASLRAGLRDRMRASPLMDAPRFARNVESAFHTMWRHRRQRSEASTIIKGAS